MTTSLNYFSKTGLTLPQHPRVISCSLAFFLSPSPSLLLEDHTTPTMFLLSRPSAELSPHCQTFGNPSALSTIYLHTKMTHGESSDSPMCHHQPKRSQVQTLPPLPKNLSSL